jgi:hypothetical protein
MIMVSVLPTPSHEPAPFEISGNFKQHFILPSGVLKIFSYLVAETKD